MKKYLIKVWNASNTELLGQLIWESSDNDLLVQEVSEILPKSCRATIEETK